MDKLLRIDRAGAALTSMIAVWVAVGMAYRFGVTTAETFAWVLTLGFVYTGLRVFWRRLP